MEAFSPSCRNCEDVVIFSIWHGFLRKDWDMLVMEFAKLARFYPDIALVVAGPDQIGLQGSLQAMARAAGFPTASIGQG